MCEITRRLLSFSSFVHFHFLRISSYQSQGRPRLYCLLVHVLGVPACLKRSTPVHTSPKSVNNPSASFVTLFSLSKTPACISNGIDRSFFSTVIESCICVVCMCVVCMRVFVLLQAGCCLVPPLLPSTYAREPMLKCTPEFPGKTGLPYIADVNIFSDSGKKGTEKKGQTNRPILSPLMAAIPSMLACFTCSMYHFSWTLPGKTIMFCTY